jgi:hypothetical protein
LGLFIYTIKHKRLRIGVVVQATTTKANEDIYNLMISATKHYRDEQGTGEKKGSSRTA